MSNVHKSTVEGGFQGEELSSSSQQSVFSRITEKVSEGLDQVAGFIDEKVKGFRGEQESSKIANVGHKTVDVLHDSANYIRKTDAEKMKTDLRESIRQNPERSLLIGLGVGVLIGSIFRKKR
jgi:hypothetical protein